MMRIGGFIKQSFVDWEGKTAAVIFIKSCNLRCGYCHNPSLVIPRLVQQSPDFHLEAIFDYLKKRKTWLDGVVISGGEPCIHKELEVLLNDIKQIGYPIKLDTNGTFPTVLQNLIIQNLIDYVSLDIKTLPDSNMYQEICGVRDEHLNLKVLHTLEILRNSEIPYQTRTTILPKYHNSKIKKKLRSLFALDNYVQQEFRPGNTLEEMIL